MKPLLMLPQVSTPFVWNPYIQPIEITERKILPNTYCNVSGWGVTDIEVSQIPEHYLTPRIYQSKFAKLMEFGTAKPQFK